MLSESFGICIYQSHNLILHGDLGCTGLEMCTAPSSHQVQFLTGHSRDAHRGIHTIAEKLFEKMESLGLILCWNPVQVTCEDNDGSSLGMLIKEWDLYGPVFKGR